MSNEEQAQALNTPDAPLDMDTTSEETKDDPELVKLPKPVPKVTGRRAVWNRTTPSDCASGATQEADDFLEIIKKMEAQRNDMKEAAKHAEEEQEAALKSFKDQVRVETASLLRQIGDLQQLIANNDEAHNRRAQRAEEKAAAREKKMDSKLNRVLAAIQANSASTPCPATDESEDEKSDYREANTAAAGAATERGRTRSPAARTKA